MILFKGLLPDFIKIIPAPVLFVFLFVAFTTPVPAYADDHDNNHSEDHDDNDNKDVHKKPLRVNAKGDLRFGKVASSINSPGTVIIDAASGAKTVTGGVFDFGGNSRRAKFKIKGEKNARIYVTLPASITIKDHSSGYLATVDTFKMNKTNPVKLNRKGKATIFVGATLRVGVNQKDKKYRGLFDIMVEYQ